MVNELVEVLIGGEREDFQNGLQRLLNRVPRRGSTTKPEFFTYLFLGSVLTLPYTELNDEIGIKGSSVKITGGRTVKLAFKIRKSQETKLVFKTINTVKGITDKEKLTIDEFKEALGSLDLTEDELNNCEVEGEIVHIKDGEVNLKTLEVIGKGELNSETLKNLGPLPGYDEETAKFKKVKGGVIEKGSLDGALKEFSRESLEVVLGEKLSPSSKGAGAFFENLSKVYRSEIVFQGNKNKSPKLGLSNYEAPEHGFVYGVLAMNFRYEYELRIRPEQAAGKGFVDLVVGSLGREFRVEFKGRTNTAQNAKLQSEKNGYDKAPIIFSFGEEQKAKSVTMMFANLCLDPGSGGLLVEQLPVPSEPEGLIELFMEHDGEGLEKKLKEKLNYLYYSISDSNGGGKNTNYLSRLILGELLADNTLKKHVFIYKENHIKPGIAEHGTRSGQVPRDVSTEMSEMVSTFLFERQDGKYVVLNVIEGEDFKIDKNIPLPEGVDLSQCIQVEIRVNPGAQGGFEVENDIDKSYYQGIEISGVTNFENKYKGEFKTIEYVSLQDITDITQVRGFQEALFPLRKLMTLENHFQAILQGLLSAQEDVEVLTEPNYSSRGRPDLMVSYDGKTGVVEVKLASTERDIEGKKREGETQLEARGDGLEVYTKEEKVAATVLVVCPNGTGKDKFITHSRLEDLNVEHSSRGSNSERILSPQSELGFQSPESVPAEELDNQFRSPRSQSNSDRSPQRPALSPIDQNSPQKRLSAEGLRRAAKCLPSPPKKPRLNKRAVIGDGCLLDMNEDKKVNKESTGIEVNEENFDESKINNERLMAYQEKIEESEINDQLNKLIIEIQQAQAIEHFSDTRKLVEGELFPALENIDEMQSENISYFEQMCKLNLLRIISPIIRDVDFKSLLFNNPEKLVKDQSLLENVFANVENLISDKYKQQQLQYEDFENLENQVNEEIISKSAEIRSIASQDVNKTDLSNYVFESVGLSLLMGQDIEVSTDLQKRVYYETLINLGSLIHDHKNHIRITHSGDQHAPRINSLVERVKSSKLLSIAYDLYYLRKNEGNVDQSNLCSGEVKSKISLYGSISSEYKLNDIYNKFDIDEFKSYFSEDELKRFSAEFEAYNKEVITIHSTQVFTGGNGVHVKVRDKSGNVKQLIIGSIEDIKNIVNYDYNNETLEIKLKVASDREYTITCEKRDGEVKYYLNIEGYKTKVGDIIKSFTNQAKGNIHWKLDQLQDKIELLTAKKDIEDIADIEGVLDQDYIREVKEDLLAKGVNESKFNQYIKQDFPNKESFEKYVDDVANKLTSKGIEFDRSKFNTAKVKGAKGNKFFSIMAIYGLFDSLKDVPILGRHDNDALKRIFGNGILDAMNDVRESLSAAYMRSDGKVVTKIRPDSAMGRILTKIPLSIRKAFVKVISNTVVESITFTTVAYQFGYSIDAIVKGDNHPLNYYFATSNGIKLASMSMKPISMGVGAAVKGLSVTTKALRVVSGVSKVLGKFSVATAVADFAFTVGISIYEAEEYVKAVANQIPLSDIEQLGLFLSKILNVGVKRKFYEDSAEVKAYLSGIVEAIANTLIGRSKRAGPDFDACLGSTKEVYEGYEIAAVVQYVTHIVKKYSEVTQLGGTEPCGPARFSCNHKEICKFEERYVDVTFDNINTPGNLSSLNISKTLPLTLGTLGGKKVYLVSSQQSRHLPHITLDEYNNGLRAVGMPCLLLTYDSTCGDTINEERKLNDDYFSPRKTKCNIDKIYRNCTKDFFLSGTPFPSFKREEGFRIGDILEKPFIFTNIKRSSSLPILYLSGPSQLIAAANYPAVMHIPKGRVNYKGSEYHDNTFIINYDAYGRIRGGTANNTIVMNYSPSMIFVRLNNGIIDAAGLEIGLSNIHNYISHSTANQNITTGCKTRYVDAGKGGGNNFVQSFDVGCQDKDYEVRKVNGKDVHSRSTKQTIFIVDQSSGSGATISFSNTQSKKNLDIIYVKCFDIPQLRINDHQNGYRLDFVAYDEKVKASVRIDSFKELVIKMGTAVTIVIQDKSLPEIIEDMVYQKLSHAGIDIDRKIVENSKKRSKALITVDITGSENTTAYAVATGIAESSDNLGTTVSQIQVIKGNIALNYAVNYLSQIKLIPNNVISDEEQKKYNNFLLAAAENGNVINIRDFLNSGADIETKNSIGTPLHVATLRGGSFDVIKFLVDQGANIEAKNLYNNTPLHHAAYKGRLDVVMYLVEKKANISAEDKYGKTPLERVNRKSEIVNFLRKKQSEYDRDLLTAASNGDIDKVRDLLNRGANIEAVNGDKSTPLHCAAWHGRLNVAKLLFDRGAKIEAKDINNSTPLLYAIQGNQLLDLVKFLVDKGANINVKNDLDQAPLGEAKKLRNPEIANFLREKQNEKPVQRKRRHHHGDHPRHHSSRKLLATDSSNQPEIAARQDESKDLLQNGEIDYTKGKATSGASKPSSWINVFANTIVGAVKGASQFISSPFKPAIDMEHSQPSKAAITQGTDVNGTLFLLNVFIRKFKGQKYVSTAEQPTISLPEAECYASDIVNRFEKVLKETAIKSGISVTNLNFDPMMKLQSYIVGQLINGKFSEISKALYSSAKQVCPDFKQNKKFLSRLETRIEEFLDKKEKEFSSIGPKRKEAKQIHKRELCNSPNFITDNPTTLSLANASRSESQLPGKTDDKPRTCLNDPTVDKHLQRSL